MKLIDVLNKWVNNEIENGTKLVVYDETGHRYTYTFDARNNEFYDEYKNTLSDNRMMNIAYLNEGVRFILPKEKKYLISVHIKGLIQELTVVNYQRLIGKIHLGSPGDTNFVQTSFTKSEIQSIEPIREFLDDMKGKYTFIEVEEYEINSLRCLILDDDQSEI